MSLLLKDKLNTWRVDGMTSSGWDVSFLKTDSESLLNRSNGINQGLFSITGDSENTVEISISWGELVEPIMLVIETVMLCLFISLKGVGQVLPLAVVEDIIGEWLRSKLALFSATHVIIEYLITHLC